MNNHEEHDQRRRPEVSRQITEFSELRSIKKQMFSNRISGASQVDCQTMLISGAQLAFKSGVQILESPDSGENIAGHYSTFGQVQTRSDFFASFSFAQRPLFFDVCK